MKGSVSRQVYITMYDPFINPATRCLTSLYCIRRHAADTSTDVMAGGYYQLDDIITRSSSLITGEGSPCLGWKVDSYEKLGKFSNCSRCNAETVCFIVM